MKSLPPTAALALVLFIGIIVGGFVTYQHYSKEIALGQAELREADNKEAKKIEKVTKEHKADTTLKDTVAKHTSKPEVTCPEVTDEEIESMCADRYVPDDIVQSLRYEIERAWGRSDQM